MDVPLDHVAVQVYGPNNQLLGHGRIPAALVPEFERLLAEAQAVNPAYTPELLVRWMMRNGHESVKRAIACHQVAAP